MRPRHIAALFAGCTALTLAAWRHYQWPCPSWLVPMLENPYFQAVAGADKLLDQAGVEAGMTVLDAGCGPGRVTLPAARRAGPAGHVTALDIQPGMIAKLSARLEQHGINNVDTIVAGLGQGQLPAERFDVAWLVTVLGEIPDQSAALREIHSSLRPGGVLSITEVLPDPHYQSLRRVRELTTAAGFREQRLYPGTIAFTLNVTKA